VLAVVQQNVSIDFVGARGRALTVWKSNSTSRFIRMPDVTVTDSLALSLPMGELWTLSTISNATKGAHPLPPPRTAFPFQFEQDFEQLANDTFAPYHAYQFGSFSVEECAGKGGGNAYKQRVIQDILMRIRRCSWACKTGRI